MKETIEDSWPDRLEAIRSLTPGVTLARDALALQVYVNVNQGAATNGHCYGMVYAADTYYHSPAELPEDATSASAIPKPTGEFESVGDDIDYYHNTQYLEFDAWYARQVLFSSEPLDYEAQLGAITSAIDETGTAGLSLHATQRGWGHQILATGYTRRENSVEVSVYDPNIAAEPSTYDGEAAPSVTFDTSGTRTTVEPYQGIYDRIVYTNVDGRIDLTGMLFQEAQQTADFIESLVTQVVTFATQSPVDLRVRGPDGAELSRLSAEHMSLAPTEYDHIRTAVGAPAGEYDVEVVGTDDGTYTLDARGQLGGRTTIEETVEGEITEGETHTYRATLPEDGAEEPRLEATDGTGDFPFSGTSQSESQDGLPGWLPIAGAGLGAAGLGGYLYSRSNSDKDQY